MKIDVSVSKNMVLTDSTQSECQNYCVLLPETATGRPLWWKCLNNGKSDASDPRLVDLTRQIFDRFKKNKFETVVTGRGISASSFFSNLEKFLMRQFLGSSLAKSLEPNKPPIVQKEFCSNLRFTEARRNFRPPVSSFCSWRGTYGSRKATLWTQPN